MAISYLSKPVAPTVEPYHEPIQYILQAAQIKQSKYDKVLDIMSSKENSLLNIDTRWASQEITDKKDNLLKKMEEDLNKTVKLDLLNPDNIKRIDNIFKPITDDKEIRTGAAFTKMQNESFATYDTWREKKPELYNPGNEAWTLEMATRNKNMSAKDFMANAQVAQAVEYVDNQKLMRESVEKLPPDIVAVETLNSETGEKGWIFSRNNKTLSYTDILAMLPNSDKSLAQAAVDAHRAFGNTGQDELLSAQRHAILDEKGSYKSVQTEIASKNDALIKKSQEILSNSAESKKFLRDNYGSDSDEMKKAVLEKIRTEIDENKKDWESAGKYVKHYDQSLSEFDQIYQTKTDQDGRFTFGKELSLKELDGLKTQVFWRNQKDQFAKAWAYSESTFKIEADPYYKANFDHRLDLETSYYDAKEAIILKGMEGKNSSGNSDGSGNSENGDGASVQSIPADQKMPEEKFKGRQDYISTMYHKGLEIGVTINEKTRQMEIKPEVGDVFKSSMDSYSKIKFGAYSNRKITPSEFKTKIADYQTVKKAFDEDPAQNLDKKIPGRGETTFRDYLINDPGAQEIESYLSTMALKTNDYKAYSKIYNNFLAEETKRAEGETGAKFNKDLTLTPTLAGLIKSPPNSSENIIYNEKGAPIGYANKTNIVIPQKFSRGFLDETLSTSQLKEIFTLNKNLGSFDNLIKIYHGGEYNTSDPKINDYKKMVSSSMESNLSALSVSPVAKVLTFRDINDSKSTGSTAVADAKKYIQATMKDKAPLYENIEVISLTPSKDGGYEFDWRTKKADANGNPVLTKGDPIKVSTEYMQDHGIPQRNLMSIEKILNMQYKYAVDKKLPNPVGEYDFDYLGKSYVFQQFGDGAYRLMIRKSNGETDWPSNLPQNSNFGLGSGSNIPSIMGGYDYIMSNGRPSFLNKSTAEMEALRQLDEIYKPLFQK